MQTLKNTTEGIYPFQQALYQKVMAGGFKHGELLVLAAGRQTGKSTLNQYYGKLFNNNLCKEILLPMKPAPKYKFGRAKWYEADLWNSIHEMSEVREWCVRQFGPQDRNPDAWSRWTNNLNSMYRFRDAKDYEWFLLRWGV